MIHHETKDLVIKHKKQVALWAYKFRSLVFQLASKEIIKNPDIFLKKQLSNTIFLLSRIWLWFDPGEAVPAPFLPVETDVYWNVDPPQQRVHWLRKTNQEAMKTMSENITDLYFLFQTDHMMVDDEEHDYKQVAILWQGCAKYQVTNNTFGKYNIYTLQIC